MSLFKIAWRNMQQRGLATVLTMFSMALGVCLVVMVLSIGWLIQTSFSRNSNVGYNLIVGAKGSPLQLTLNTVYYLSRTIEVLPYDEYLEFLPKDERTAEIQKIGGQIAQPDRAGRYGETFMKGGFAIPVCLGDYFGPFRVVGTKPGFFENLRYGEGADLKYEFAQGRNFVDYSEENGFFEAVLGSHVAAEMKIKVGDEIKTTHGDPEGEGHGQGFKVVGILKSTGTPNDRATFINIEGFYWMEGHARAIEPAEMAQQERTEVVAAPAAANAARLPLEKRDLTAVLIKPANGMYAMSMERDINKSLRAQAASPIREITTMLENFVKPINDALLALTAVVCLVSAISILVSIYNSMNERRRDIAVMRALGARRDVVMAIILIESLLIAIIGGGAGWVAAHLIGMAFSPAVEYRTGIQLGLLTSVTTYELWLIPGLMGLATLAGLIPAMAAYRTDVSRNL
ncbi:MAG: ABC transporter permease [Pirellulaceae bacterium]|nr:ABC transporter permease [Pirellulaceae bacterium]